MKAIFTLSNSDSTNSFDLAREGFKSFDHALQYGAGLAAKVSAAMGEPHYVIRVTMGESFAYTPHHSYWSAGISEA